jgi:2-keto-4-pentenoate hydratase
MQTLLGVDEPDFGYILDDMVLGNGSAVPAARFCAPRVEPEVALSPTGPGDHASITISGLGAVSLTFT